jgi:D-alanine-D-alanine ligase
LHSTQLSLALPGEQAANAAITVGLFFGGRSAEHEISIRSATTIHAALRAAGYRVVTIGIERAGTWRYMPLAGEAFHRAVDPRACAVTLAPGGAGQLLACDGPDAAGTLPRIAVAFPRCTARSARTAACKACSRPAACPTRASACWPARWPWTRKRPSAC